MEAHRGEWGHGDWSALLDVLGRSQYWPLDPEAVGAVLEEAKRRYWNLRRWLERTPEVISNGAAVDNQEGRCC